MKNLVIAVSPDSSLELLGSYADIIILDKDPLSSSMTVYDTVYIRSHFSQPSTLPQKFRSEIDDLVQRTKNLNPKVKFIDNMDTVDQIVDFEDKWHQYKIFHEFMPRTELLDEHMNSSSFVRPVFKKRLSSRGEGVTWDKEKTNPATGDWIIQESIDIDEELRIYAICGEVHPIGTIRQSKTLHQKTQAINSRKLTQVETDFASDVISRFPDLDLAGLDVARTLNGQLSLMEVNRSPGFAKFNQLADADLASVLYTRVARR